METQCLLTQADFDILKITFSKIKTKNEGSINKLDLKKSIEENFHIENFLKKNSIKIIFSENYKILLKFEDILDFITNEYFYNLKTQKNSLQKKFITFFEFSKILKNFQFVNL